MEDFPPVVCHTRSKSIPDGVFSRTHRKIDYHITVTPRSENVKTGIEVSVVPVKSESRFFIWKTSNSQSATRSVSEDVDLSAEDLISKPELLIDFDNVEHLSTEVPVTDVFAGVCGNDSDDLLSF